MKVIKQASHVVTTVSAATSVESQLKLEAVHTSSLVYFQWVLLWSDDFDLNMLVLAIHLQDEYRRGPAAHLDEV